MGCEKILQIKVIVFKKFKVVQYPDENVSLKVNRALSKLITLLIWNKKEFKHFFKSRSSDNVLLKLGNLHQNAKRYEAHNTEREARDENVRAKRADFFFYATAILLILHAML